MTRRTTPPAQPEPAHVELTSGTRQVIVKSGDPLDAVAAKAIELWPLTAPDVGPGEQVGFSMHPASEPVLGPLMPSEISLPHRLIPQQEKPDDRRNT